MYQKSARSRVAWFVWVQCADCIYRFGVPDLLVTTFVRLMGPNTTVLVAADNHHPEVIDEFRERVKKCPQVSKQSGISQNFQGC